MNKKSNNYINSDKTVKSNLKDLKSGNKYNFEAEDNQRAVNLRAVRYNY